MFGKLAKSYTPDTLRRDFLSSLVVFLVALPLCLGIAIASGAPPMLGLVTGIIGGIVVGMLAGCPLQVSGPAAGLVAIVYEIIVDYGLEGLGVIVLLAGLMQLAAGIMKMGQWFRAISPAVIQGMLAGIGVLIVASQFHVMLDVTPESKGIDNILTIPQTIMLGLFPPHPDASHHWAAMVGVMTIVTIILWNTLPGRLKLMPAALAAVLLAVTVSLVLGLPIRYVEMPNEFLSALSFPHAGTLNFLVDSNIWIMAITVAIVASAETLLSASAVDRMQQRAPRTHYDKEMLAQGVGNTLCGLVGALPMTGVIVRSSANIQAGAMTRMSTIFHGTWILILVSLFPHVLEMIPTAALAAILVFTGYKLVQPAAIRKLWAIGPGEVAVYMVTMVMVVATNLLEGVIAGIVLALLKLLYTFSKLEGKSITSEGGQRVDLFLKGSATFISLPKLVSILESQPLGKELHVHVEDLGHLDHACLELLQGWEKQYAMSGGNMAVEWQVLNGKFGGNMPDPKVLAGATH